jgi:hypothetical protein
VAGIVATVCRHRTSRRVGTAVDHLREDLEALAGRGGQEEEVGLLNLTATLAGITEVVGGCKRPSPVTTEYGASL